MDETDVLFSVAGPLDAFLRDVSAGDTSGPGRALKAGVRVTFTEEREALLAYPHPPAPGAGGTVVSVRTSSGARTAYEGHVFVRWDEGGFLPVSREHLEVVPGARSAAYRRVVADLGDLGDFIRVAGGDEDELVHKATRDLWALRQEGGQYVIERLFDEGGSPLKV